MEQLFFAGKAYLKINSLVKTPLHEFMAVERSGLWAPGRVKWRKSRWRLFIKCDLVGRYASSNSFLRESKFG